MASRRESDFSRVQFNDRVYLRSGRRIPLPVYVRSVDHDSRTMCFEGYDDPVSFDLIQIEPVQQSGVSQ